MFEILLIVFAIAAFAASRKTRARLALIERRIAAFDARLEALEAGRPPIAPEPQGEAPPRREAAAAPGPATAEPDIMAAPPEPEPTPQEETSTPPPITPPPAPPARPSWEEQFGTRWVVWVGGLALALGGIFLVRYSIERGLIGPGVRVFLGGLLAAALLAAGEWTRRSEIRANLAGVATAHIPSILTAAGTTVAYATVFAAYELYGFIGPAVAFVLLGVVALATLAAALLHGPALAGLGLVGAEVTPVLVSTAEPNYWALYIYLAVVTGAAFALARMRLWRWLAVTAVVFGLMWMLPGIDVRDALAPHAFHALAGFALAAALIVAGLFYGPDPAPGRIDATSSSAIGAYVLGAMLLVIATHHDSAALIVFTLLVVATVAVGWRSEAAMGAVPAAAAMAVLVILSWATELDRAHLVAPGGATAGLLPEPNLAHTGSHIMTSALFAAVFGGAGYFALGKFYFRALTPLLWSLTSALTPVAILIALYGRIARYEQSIPFAGLALLLAAIFAVATEMLTKRAPKPGLASAAAIYATGAVAALALALTFALEKGWLTVALALMVPGVAWIARQRPLPMLRWLAAALVLLVLARIVWEPRIVGGDVGTTPIFNWLLYGYGVPALAFWVAGWLLRKRADDVPARMVDSAAILFTVLLAFLEIRHYVNSGDVYHASAGLTEIGLQVSVGLAMAIGLERVRGRTGSVVHDIGAQLVAAAALAGIVFGLVLFENPLLTNRSVGGPFVNLILLCYGLPAVLSIALALVARATRPMWYRSIAAATSVALAILYLTLEVRRLYHGPWLGAGVASDAEQYTYSAVWLAFGVVLLLVGLVLQSKPARLASAAVVLLTIAKVFLVDMAGVTGIWRALSFIGLGLVLVGIGYLYQRLLFPPRARAASTS